MMQVLSSRLFKSFVTTVILVVSGAASADCNSNCDPIARRYAEEARASVLTKLSTCDQYKSDPAAYNACTAPIYTEAQNRYNYVYSQAYAGCMRACPL
jgi:hypothetical protein